MCTTTFASYGINNICEINIGIYRIWLIAIGHIEADKSTVMKVNTVIKQQIWMGNLLIEINTFPFKKILWIRFLSSDKTISTIFDQQRNEFNSNVVAESVGSVQFGFRAQLPKSLFAKIRHV